VSETINTAECVEVVRALVAAFEEKGQPLRRILRDEYREDSYLHPYRLDISTELVERGLKALGLPAPETPKPKKIPARPTDAQARALDYLNCHRNARLVAQPHWNNVTSYRLTRAPDVDEMKVAPGVVEKLKTYKWIAFERKDEGYKPPSYYKLTDAGYEALTRYQVKIGVVA
jgi:hypothetical protein